jgi:hypothetical protein
MKQNSRRGVCAYAAVVIPVAAINRRRLYMEKMWNMAAGALFVLVMLCTALSCSSAVAADTSESDETVLPESAVESAPDTPDTTGPVPETPAPGSDTAVLGPVKNLAVSYSISASAITVTWSDPSDSVLNNIVLTYGKTGAAGTTVTIEKGIQTYTMTGISADKSEYTISAATGDAAGNRGAVQTITIKPLAYNAGDIVLSDGTTAAAETITDIQKASAVAVIFFVSDNGRTALGVGLHHCSSINWAERLMAGCLTNFEEIQCEVTGSVGYYSFSGDIDGSNNWAEICGHDPIYTVYADTYYPAFDYVNKYAAAEKLSGSMASGWYMPSVKELYDLYKNHSTVDTAITAAGGTALGTAAGYWSSSQYIKYYYYAWSVNFGSGAAEKDYKQKNGYNVCVIRSFDAPVQE